MAALGLVALAAAHQPAQAQANILFVLTDDMSAHEMAYMPKTAQYMAANGTRFSQAFVTNSYCCPSRVTTLSGRYSHNTGVYTNDPSAGGFETFFSTGQESSTAATWLKSVGYNTAFFGKYLNGYGTLRATPANYVPPGWDQWYGLWGSLKYFDYALNENGTVVKYGNQPEHYATDVLAAKALTVLDRFMGTGRPFFMMFAPFGPHATTDGPEDDESRLMAIPAPRHQSLYEGITAPRLASFNEADVSDKSPVIRGRAPLTDADIAWIDQSQRTRAQSLASVDEAVAAMLAKLAANPAGRRTYVVFTSDNGFFFGEHRLLAGKGHLFDSASRVPLYIAGPSVQKGVERPELVLNTDLAPTFAQWAGVRPPTNVDGRSIDPLLRTTSRVTSHKRKAFLTQWIQRARGLRLGTYSYNEVTTGSEVFPELYDLVADPDQTKNIVSRLTPESKSALSSALLTMSKCAGSTCRSAEDSTSDSLVVFKP